LSFTVAPSLLDTIVVRWRIRWYCTGSWGYVRRAWWTVDCAGWSEFALPLATMPLPLPLFTIPLTVCVAIDAAFAAAATAAFRPLAVWVRKDE
jgi:hypothetical protein